MDKRCELFENYFLPSLFNQSDKDFHVFLLCDSSTPKKYKEKFLNLESKYHFLNFIYNKENLPDKSTLNLIIDRYKFKRKNNSDTLLVSRADNDDMVGRDYNLLVKELLGSRDWITFSEGICINHANHNHTTYFRFPKGPFVSRKSTLDDPQTPYGIIHHDVPSESIKTNIPIWAQVVHGDNLDNQMRGPIVQVDKNFLFKNFGLA